MAIRDEDKILIETKYMKGKFIRIFIIKILNGSKLVLVREATKKYFFSGQSTKAFGSPPGFLAET